MLDAFIIEEIKRRERDREQDRPRLELPLTDPTRPRSKDDERDEEDGGKRGVIIIDYSSAA